MYSFGEVQNAHYKREKYMNLSFYHIFSLTNEYNEPQVSQVKIHDQITKREVY